MPQYRITLAWRYYIFLYKFILFLTILILEIHYYYYIWLGIYSDINSDSGGIRFLDHSLYLLATLLPDR